jgi:hypothetical protein
MVRLLMAHILLAAFAFGAAVAHADSLTLACGGSLRTYEGAVLAIDQVGVDADLRFRATSVVEAPSAPTLRRAKLLRPGVWSVAIDDQDAQPIYIAHGCRIAALAYMHAGGMHVYLDCTEATGP